MTMEEKIGAALAGAAPEREIAALAEATVDDLQMALGRLALDGYIVYRAPAGMDGGHGDDPMGWLFSCAPHARITAHQIISLAKDQDR